MFDEFLNARREQELMTNDRKSGNNEAVWKFKQELREKAERSAKAVEAFQEKEARKNMLNKELAKLKEGDMQKVHQRQKRLEMRKKRDIITKDITNF